MRYACTPRARVLLLRSCVSRIYISSFRLPSFSFTEIRVDRVGFSFYFYNSSSRCVRAGCSIVVVASAFWLPFFTFSFKIQVYIKSLAVGSCCVSVYSIVHLRYIRPRASAARGCANAAPVAMPPPTETSIEGCPGLVGDACARQLDGGVDGRRPPYRRRG